MLGKFVAQLGAVVIRIGAADGEGTAHGLNRPRRRAERILIGIELNELLLNMGRSRLERHPGRIATHVAHGLRNQIKESAHWPLMMPPSASRALVRCSRQFP